MEDSYKMSTRIIFTRSRIVPVFSDSSDSETEDSTTRLSRKTIRARTRSCDDQDFARRVTRKKRRISRSPDIDENNNFCDESSSTSSSSSSRTNFNQDQYVDEVFKKVKQEKIYVTRKLRSQTGIKIFNPFQYDDCLLCTKGYYKEEDLREHYYKIHDLDFGSAPLPRDEEALEKCQFHYLQQSRKCPLCTKYFANQDDLFEHKTRAHIDPRFMRHKCKGCGHKFLLHYQLEEHESECKSKAQA